MSEYNNATGVFTALYPGWYRVSAAASTNAFAWLAGTQFHLKVMKNAVQYAVGTRDFKSNNSTGNAQASAMVDTTVYLAAGDTISVAGFTDRTPDADLNNISASAISNHISIDRLY